MDNFLASILKAVQYLFNLTLYFDKYRRYLPNVIEVHRKKYVGIYDLSNTN